MFRPRRGSHRPPTTRLAHLCHGVIAGLALVGLGEAEVNSPWFRQAAEQSKGTNYACIALVVVLALTVLASAYRAIRPKKPVPTPEPEAQVRRVSIGRF